MLFNFPLLLLKSGIRTTPQKQCQTDFVKQSSNPPKALFEIKNKHVICQSKWVRIGKNSSVGLEYGLEASN